MLSCGQSLGAKQTTASGLCPDHRGRSAIGRRRFAGEGTRRAGGSRRGPPAAKGGAGKVDLGTAKTSPVPGTNGRKMSRSISPRRDCRDRSCDAKVEINGYETRCDRSGVISLARNRFSIRPAVWSILIRRRQSIEPIEPPDLSRRSFQTTVAVQRTGTAFWPAAPRCPRDGTGASQLDYEEYPDSERGLGCPAPSRTAGSSGSANGNVTPIRARRRLIKPAGSVSGILICKANSKRAVTVRHFSQPDAERFLPI